MQRRDVGFVYPFLLRFSKDRLGNRNAHMFQYVRAVEALQGFHNAFFPTVKNAVVRLSVSYRDGMECLMNQSTPAQVILNDPIQYDNATIPLFLCQERLP